VLAQHGVVETSTGFTWSYDPKLIAGSEVRLTQEQVLAFRDRISAATLVVVAEEGLVLPQPAALEFLSPPGWQLARLPGGHHHHMHEQARAIAGLIKQHFSS
jgi:hypothetical protein